MVIFQSQLFFTFVGRHSSMVRHARLFFVKKFILHDTTLIGRVVNSSDSYFGRSGCI